MQETKGDAALKPVAWMVRNYANGHWFVTATLRGYEYIEKERVRELFDEKDVAIILEQNIRYREALEIMKKLQTCDCGCPGGEKPILMKPHHYYAIAQEALKSHDEYSTDGKDVVVSVAGAEAYLRAADQIDSGATTKDLREIAYAILDTCRKNALELNTPNAVLTRGAEDDTTERGA